MIQDSGHSWFAQLLCRDEIVGAIGNDVVTWFPVGDRHFNPASWADLIDLNVRGAHPPVAHRLQNPVTTLIVSDP